MHEKIILHNYAYPPVEYSTQTNIQNTGETKSAAHNKWRQTMADKVENQKNNAPEQNPQSNWEEASREITAEALKNFFVTNLTKLDRDNSGRITKKEIDAAVFTGQNHPGTWNDKEIEMLHTLKNNYSTLSKITAAKGGGEGSHLFSEINPRDMIVFANLYKQLKQEQSELTKATDYAKENFSKLDKDGNGYISMPELWSSKDALTPEVSTLMKHAHKAKKASNDEWFFERKGLSRKDLEKYPEQWKKETDHLTDGACSCAMCRGFRPSKGSILDVTKK
jgi:Ca2+-binding EF-hand superfamily protein